MPLLKMRSQEIGSQEMSSREIGSSLISFELIFEALKSELLSFEFTNSGIQLKYGPLNFKLKFIIQRKLRNLG